MRMILRLMMWVGAAVVLLGLGGCWVDEANSETVHERWMVSLDQAVVTGDGVVILSGCYVERGEAARKEGPANFRLQVPVGVLAEPDAPSSAAWRMSSVYGEKRVVKEGTDGAIIGEPGMANGLSVLARWEHGELVAFPVVMRPGDQRMPGPGDRVLEIKRLGLPAGGKRELKLAKSDDPESDYHRLGMGLVKGSELPEDIPRNPGGPVFFRRSYGRGSIEVFCVAPVPESDFYQVTMLVLSPRFTKDQLYLIPAVPLAVGAGAAAGAAIWVYETPEQFRARTEAERDK